MVFIRPKDLGKLIKKKDHASLSMHDNRKDSRSREDDHEVRKGYVPVMVGCDGMCERFMVRTQLMKHPSILSFLELSAHEFGYKQQGVLQIPCEPDAFREVINKLM
ncbi:hypothetical protein Droror1_Dr00004145 [Drosera rotundifolia]